MGFVAITRAAAATLPLPEGSAAATLPHHPGVDEATIQAAIDRLTRALAAAADDAIAGLVDERRALRGRGGYAARRAGAAGATQ
jgi:hypothetical protein